MFGIPLGTLLTIGRLLLSLVNRIVDFLGAERLRADGRADQFRRDVEALNSRVSVSDDIDRAETTLEEDRRILAG